MQIQTSPPRGPQRPRKLGQADTTPPTPPPAPEEPKKKPTTGMSLPPNNRFHWDEKIASRVRKLRDIALPLMFRMEDKGFENIPKDGNFIVGPTHQNYMDALIGSRVPDGHGPFGSMSDVNQFKGIVGTMLSGFGSFPVDRYREYEGDFPKPSDHAEEILNTGKNFIFYPEGRIFDTDFVQPLQTGVGRISVNSKVKYALPVAQDYRKDTKSHPVETAVGVALSAAAAGAGIWAACSGGLGGGIAGLVTGLVSGALVGGGVGYLAADKQDYAKTVGKAAKFAGLGALATGLGGAAIGGFAPGLAPAVVGTTSVLTGMVGLAGTYHWTHRAIATTSVGKPIEVEPYRQRARESSDPDAAMKESLRLVSDFHGEMKQLKDELTGRETPYKMTPDGRSWIKTEDGRYALVEQKDKKNWTIVEPRVYES